jgi:hypothetical protein
MVMLGAAEQRTSLVEIVDPLESGNWWNEGATL